MPVTRTFHESELNRQRTNPRFQARTRVMDIIALAFLAAVPLYAAIVHFGLIPASQGTLPSFLWMTVIGVGVAGIPAMLIVLRPLLAQARDASGFDAAANASQVAMIVALAFGEALAVYGVIMPVIGGPIVASYGLFAASLTVLAAIVIRLRTTLHRIMLAKLAEEAATH